MSWQSDKVENADETMGEDSQIGKPNAGKVASASGMWGRPSGMSGKSSGGKSRKSGIPNC